VNYCSNSIPTSVGRVLNLHPGFFLIPDEISPTLHFNYTWSYSIYTGWPQYTQFPTVYPLSKCSHYYYEIHEKPFNRKSFPTFSTCFTLWSNFQTTHYLKQTKIFCHKYVIPINVTSLSFSHFFSKISVFNILIIIHT